MKYKRHAFLWLAILLGTTPSLQAQLRTAAIFSDNMVLQRQMPVPIWGWTTPGAPVTVTFAGQTRSTRADATGRWLVRLHPLPTAATARSLVIQSGGTLTFTNVLVGEVWLASGQSNMEKPLGLQRGQKPCFNYQQELAAADYPQIRLFQVEKVMSEAPLDDLRKFRAWQPCDSNSLDSISFSAAAYFFGRDLHTNLNVPIGLIESAWGGTRIEPWMPPAGFAVSPALAALTNQAAVARLNKLSRPSVLYNAMIAPLTGCAMRGAIWYQGESNLMDGTNSYDYLNYDDKMVAMVESWRRLWHEGEFPFYFVQIAPFKYAGGKIQRVPSRESLPVFWTIQSRAARRLHHAGMVVTTDLVNDVRDIHPRDKQDVGHRLALLALRHTYDRPVVCTGPVFEHAKSKGSTMVLSFKHAEGGLKSRDGQPLDWFEVAGRDGDFVTASAQIAGQKIVVSSPAVPQPVAVRFAWDETAQPNLCNQAGLPAEPFRTREPRP